MSKTNWELNKTKFANLGINHYELPTDIFDWLKTKSFEAKEKDIDARESLAGHIRQEYFIKSNWAQEYKKDLGVDTDETFLRFGNWLSQRCFEKPLNMFTGTHYVLSRDRKMIISSLWANFQKKYEFNPPHTHGGVYSFIVFVNVPYNYESEKGVSIDYHSKVGLSFFWPPLERQIIIKGEIEKISPEDSDDYFSSRPKGSQISALISEQSKVIKSREILEQKMNMMEKKYSRKQIKRPDNWGGYLVKPKSFEFWQGRPNRLHDRILCTLLKNSWDIKRLSP